MCFSFPGLLSTPGAAISPDIIDNYFEREEAEGEFDRGALAPAPTTTKVRYNNGIIVDADVQATLRCKLDSGTLTSGTDSEIIENNNLDAQDGMYGSQQDDLQFYYLQLNKMFVLDKGGCHIA